MSAYRQLLATATVLFVFTGASGAAEPLNIRIGWANTPATISPLLFQKTDIMRHYGKSYVVEAIRFDGTTRALAAIKEGKLDIGSVSFSNVGAAIVQQGMGDLRIIADGNQGGVEGYASIPYYVRNDSPIKAIKDLKGKTLASNASGGAADFGLRAALMRHGLEAKRDYNLIESPFPTLGKLLLEGKVDLVAMTAPFVYDPQLKAGARVLFTLKDEIGPIQQLVTASRQDFLKRNRAQVVDFFEDYLIALRWFHDPANRNEAIRHIGTLHKVAGTAVHRMGVRQGRFLSRPVSAP